MKNTNMVVNEGSKFSIEKLPSSSEAPFPVRSYPRLLYCKPPFPWEAHYLAGKSVSTGKLTVHKEAIFLLGSRKPIMHV